MANQELIELIASERENLSCAWEIKSVIHDVENLLRGRFWHAVHKNLVESVESLDDPELRSAWSVQISPSLQGRTDRLIADGGIYVAANVSEVLQLGVWQENGWLLCGMRFAREQKQPQPAEVETLRTLLRSEWDAFGAEWWLVGHDTGYRISDQDFLLDIVDAASVSEPLADRVIKVLRDHPKQVIAANAALASAASSRADSTG